MAEIKYPDINTILKLYPQCLLFNPNYYLMVILLPVYTLIANTILIITAIKAIPSSNILTTI